MSAPELLLSDDLAAVAVLARDRIVAAAAGAIERRGRFRLCIDGGRPTQRLLELLAATPSLVDWAHTELFLGDERRTPIGDARSNRALVERLLLDALPVKPAFHAPHGELPDGPGAAQAFETVWREKLGVEGVDILLLGLGSDGHTASIFPHSPALVEGERWVMAVEAPSTAEPKIGRLTLTPPPILAARELLLLAVGDEKRAALRRLLARDGSEGETPARLIRRYAGVPVILADRHAAA